MVSVLALTFLCHWIYDVLTVDGVQFLSTWQTDNKTLPYDAARGFAAYEPTRDTIYGFGTSEGCDNCGFMYNLTNNSITQFLIDDSGLVLDDFNNGDACNSVLINETILALDSEGVIWQFNISDKTLAVLFSQHI